MKIVPNIFKIDREVVSLKNEKDTPSIIRKILKESYKRRELALDIDNKDITVYSRESITYYLYIDRATDIESDWSSFLPVELKKKALFLQTKINLIIFIETERDLYAIVGGASFWIIANFIDHLFGLITYDKIVLLEEDIALSTKSRGITGQRVGFNEQFRDDYRMINYLQFGKIPKSLHVKLAQKTSFTHFEFLLSKPFDRLQIAVGKGFKINKEVSFDLLHLIIKRLHQLVALEQKELLSSYIHIRDNDYLKKLRDLLSIKIYNHIAALINQSKDPDDVFEFDFCNPTKIEEFYEAEKYKLIEKTDSGKKKDGHFATVTDKSQIYETVIRRAYETIGDNQVGLISYLYGVSVQCYVGKKQTASSGFMYHFNAEFSDEQDAVFLIDGKWYRLKETFIESLKGQTERILRNSKLTNGILYEKWAFDSTRKKFDSEGAYNMLYDGKPNYLVLDTIIAEGIELCDIMHITDNEIFLIHVKHSFTSRVRELTNQILISGRRLREAISAKQRSFFDAIYNGLLSKGRHNNHLSNDDFYSLFLTKKPVYVFATASQLVDDLPIEDYIEAYDSNIARFSLTTCSGEMQTNYYEMKTFQIERV